MKTALVAAALAVATSLLGATRVGSDPAAAPTALGALAAGYHAAMVRVEYAAANGRIANTVCHLTNTSISQSIVLKHVVVLRAGGVGPTMAVYNGLLDQVLPPLGSIDLTIDNTIPGVFQQTTPGGPSVHQVAFIWDGDAEVVNLSASIETSLSFNIYTRAEMIERGVALQP